MVNSKSSIINAAEPTHFESLYPENARKKEIGKIFGFVKGGRSCQLIGLPGSGRSSILGLLSYNRNVRIHHTQENQKWFHFVHVDFSEMKGKPLHEATKFLFLELIDSLHERNLETEHQKMQEIFKEVLSLRDELVFFQGLKRAIHFLAIEKELTIVFLLDRFETYIPILTSDFFANLRVLRNHAKYRFSAVFSLSRPLDILVDPFLFADFYEFLAGNTVYVSLFDKPSFDFRLSYIEKVNGKRLEKSIVNKLLTLTGGHGKLTRLSLETLLQEENPKTIEEALLSQRVIQAALFELWQYLIPAEQHVLVSENKKEDTFLEYVGLLQEGKIAIPLFETFLKQNREAEKEEQFVYDPETREIKHGDQVISNKLTALEFRLFRYLLEHHGKLIERDELVNVVWQESKSTAGVTDQALDQLIFRLRKKIEEDPNNPVHLQTIKGRGFQFKG